MAFKAQNIFIHCAVALCIVFFLLLMTDTINKFSQKMTSIGVIIKESHSQTKILPCVTICPWRPFKSLGFHFNAENFSRSTFEKKEIFLNSSKLTLPSPSSSHEAIISKTAESDILVPIFVNVDFSSFQVI